ncbi:MAG: DUF4270 domain-containing protein [Alloprevotella sp.]|nr:DUF4270 domain-containing protein [Alloprevotella sp.]
MKKISLFLTFAALAGLFTACDEDTLTVGAEVMPGMDVVASSRQSFSVVSRSIHVDSVLANTNSCYLGSVIDPETRAKTTCDFLAQFYLMENFALPAPDRLAYRDESGVLADSCLLRLYFSGYYGDSLATMKLTVTELDTNRVMDEGVSYYTDIAPADYVNAASPYEVSQTYSLRGVSRQVTSSSAAYAGSLVVKLPAEYATAILRKYHANPEFFQNSYSFIHHVCPGFYVRTSGGVGSMLNVEMSVLDLFFSYHTTTAAGADTIEGGMQRLAATEEVIQNTHIENTIPAEMLDEGNAYTYLKSPAGIFTEVTLPVGDIVAGEHYTDTINAARITFPRINTEAGVTPLLSPASTILMLRKSELFSFFEQGRVADGRTAFIVDYQDAYNAYVFSNIASLITQMKLERDAGAGVSRTESEAVRNVKYAAWEAANPDWNKVVLVPVAADYSTTSSSYSTTTKTLLRVRNELGLSSAKLVGGPSGDLNIAVTYSRFNAD